MAAPAQSSASERRRQFFRWNLQWLVSVDVYCALARSSTDKIIGSLVCHDLGYLVPSQSFQFICPPNSICIINTGDLGQTEWTKSTLQHVGAMPYDVFLLPGDLSYADTLQPLWDSFGSLVEPLASSRPWMVTQGNHEIETIPVLHPQSFTAYNARWLMPYKESQSTSNLYYSFDVSGAHVIMLGSYTDFDVGSNQYMWLQADLTAVDRTKTPWIFVLLHAPWYNSNLAHQGEGESMRKAMEEMLFKERVDLVLAGHVHAYERFVSNSINFLDNL